MIARGVILAALAGSLAWSQDSAPKNPTEKPTDAERIEILTAERAALAAYARAAQLQAQMLEASMAAEKAGAAAQKAREKVEGRIGCKLTESFECQPAPKAPAIEPKKGQ